MLLSNQNHNWPKKTENLWLSVLSIIFFLSIWSIIILCKLYFDSGHYQTVDGNNYFLLAHKIRNGQQFIIEGLKNVAGKPFSPYPPGFPLLLNIGISLENLTHISAVFSLHLILLAGLLLIWTKKRLPLLPLLMVSFTDTFLELACNPWSEFSFILILIFTALFVSELEFKSLFRLSVLPAILLFFVCQIRYAGIFMLGFILVKFWQNKATRESLNFWIRTGVWFGLMLMFWFLIEVYFYGQVTGGDRYANTQSFQILALDLCLGLFNQILIFKDWSGSSTQSFTIGVISTIIF